MLFECQSPLISFRPGVYSSWGARGQYKVTDEISIQTGAWNYIEAYPFNNGWEWDEGESALSAFGNITYEKEGTYIEALLWGSDETQTDPLTGEETDGESGIYLGYKKPLYEGGEGGGFFKVPSVTFVEQFTYGFNDQNSKGLSYTNAVGLNIGSPIVSRPYDQYGVLLKTYQITDQMHQSLQDGYASNGVNYDKDDMQKAIQFDANFVLTPYLIVSAFGQYSWDVNSKNNPYNQYELPEDGVGFGLMGIILLDKLI
jgi:carbohydrate-selective porin OprB